VAQSRGGDQDLHRPVQRALCSGKRMSLHR
jgi:hypothetical protein